MNPLLRFGLWLDVQVLHLVTFDRSLSGETISAAAWSLEGDGKWQGKLIRPLIDGLFYFVQKRPLRAGVAVAASSL